MTYTILLTILASIYMLVLREKPVPEKISVKEKNRYKRPLR